MYQATLDNFAFSISTAVTSLKQSIPNGKLAWYDDLDVDWSDLQSKPSFASVATSGSYNDLSNKPSIPTVPDNISAFTNDKGYLTSVSWSDVQSKPNFSQYAFTGTDISWSDVTNKPVLAEQPDIESLNFAVFSALNALKHSIPNGKLAFYDSIVVSWDDIKQKPSFASIATSASASDLNDGTLDAGLIPNSITREFELKDFCKNGIDANDIPSNIT